MRLNPYEIEALKADHPVDAMKIEARVQLGCGRASAAKLSRRVFRGRPFFSREIVPHFGSLPLPVGAAYRVLARSVHE
jgi:hypothetical protein